MRDWREARAKVESEGRCRACGIGGPLDAAHLIGRGRIPGHEVMSADNIVALCRSCHTKFDSHRLDLLPVLTLPEQGHMARLVGLVAALQRATGEGVNPPTPDSVHR